MLVVQTKRLERVYKNRLEVIARLDQIRQRITDAVINLRRDAPGARTIYRDILGSTGLQMLDLVEALKEFDDLQLMRECHDAEHGTSFAETDALAEIVEHIVAEAPETAQDILNSLDKGEPWDKGDTDINDGGKA